MRLGDVGDLPTVLRTPQAADVLGCSVWKLLELARRGEAPVEPVRIGRVLRWPTAAVLRAIGPTEGVSNGRSSETKDADDAKSPAS